MRIQMPFSFLRLPTRMQLPQLLRELEQDMETVINVLKPGPLGIIEHKFSAAEVQEAKATVRRAVENWQRNSALERNGRTLKHSENKMTQP